MSKRRINPATGQVELTCREQKLVDEYIKNGGNGKQAAIAAGYGAARADQSAYQVLRRAEVQQHIRDRISESRVSSEEIIGTLVSCMRGNLAQCLTEDGDFDIKLVKQKRLGHLLKTISGTTRRIRAKDGGPSEIIRNYRVQLHSPLQAASILARLKGLHRGSPEPSLHSGPGLNSAPEPELHSAPESELHSAPEPGPHSAHDDTLDAASADPARSFPDNPLNSPAGHQGGPAVGLPLDSANVNLGSDTGSRSGGRPLAARDSGPPQSYEAHPVF